MADTPWCGQADDKLYLQSGQFTSTIKTSEDINSIEIYSTGITWDGTNTPWCGQANDKLYLQSGQFTSTIKDSEDVSIIDNDVGGISWDGINTPWCGNESNKLFLQSEQFTSIIKTSQNVTGTAPLDISYDGTNTPWIDITDGKLYLQSGQFTSTIKTSEDINGTDIYPTGISYDGVNTPWCGWEADKLYLQSGQFTSTIKTSKYIGDIDSTPGNVCTNDVDSRLDISGEIIEKSVTNAITLNQSASQSGSIFNRSLTDTITFVQNASGAKLYDTPWAGEQTHKLYLQSGQFTSIIKDSEDVSSLSPSFAIGICWDGTNTPWSSDYANKLYLQSGQFTSILKTSQDINGIDIAITDISADNNNTPWSGAQADKLYLTSGQFSSTIKDSEVIDGIDLIPHGISYDGTNTPWSGITDNKLYLQSGQFTSTLITSHAVGSIDTDPTGISWDGSNTLWCGAGDDKLYLQSGQFTSTLKESEDVSAIDNVVVGICTNAISERIGGLIYEKLTDNTINFVQVLSSNVEYFRSLSNTLSLNQTTIKAIGQFPINTILFNQIVSANVMPPPTTEIGGNSMLNRFIRKTLYSLKRQYGNKVDLYKLINAETDYQTGVKTVDKSAITIRKCIVLPVKIAREAIQTIAHISANKMFVYGGSYDAGTRMFIIDARDLPIDYEIVNDDWLIYNNRRYEIKNIEEFEQHTAWVIVAKEVKGVKPEQIYHIQLTEQFVLNSQITTS